MEEELQKLFDAFEHDGDIKACVKIVARNFPAFSANDIIFTFPDELLVDILMSEEFNYPEPEQIANFFIKVFDKGADFVHLYYPLIPLDHLTKSECERIVEKLTEIKCVVEANQLSRVVNLYEKIEFAQSELKASDDSSIAISEKLQQSTDMLDRMTTLLRSTTQTLDQTTEELKNKTDENIEKEKEITRLKFEICQLKKK